MLQVGETQHFFRMSEDEEKVKSLGVPYTAISEGFRISVPNTKAATELIISSPAVFEDFEIVKGKMDDVFLAVTGKSLIEEKTETTEKGGRRK